MQLNIIGEIQKGFFIMLRFLLKAGGEKFGLLNVASPGKTHFSEEELVLLQSVAFQIGTAFKTSKVI